MSKIKNVNYRVLDQAKNAFIEASKKTITFAAPFGFVPESGFGASANLFALDLRPFIKSGAESIYVTLLPEGLGTADDARPEDLNAAEAVEFWSNIGIKSISALTNDAASAGLQTILIGLYLPSSTPEIVFNPEFMKGFLDGFVAGCREVGCVYISGETPQLLGKIVEGKLDIAGALFALRPAAASAVRQDKLAAGNYVVLVESSGPHENGFTVLRKTAEKLSDGYRTKLPSGKEFWRAINAPSKLYTPLVQSILKSGLSPTGIENITGHGWQKIMRSQRPLRYRIEKLLPSLEIFDFVEGVTGASKQEMYSTFNCGAGLAIFCESLSDAEGVCAIAQKFDMNAIVAGKIETAEQRQVFIEPHAVKLDGSEFALKK